MSVSIFLETFHIVKDSIFVPSEYDYEAAKQTYPREL